MLQGIKVGDPIRDTAIDPARMRILTIAPGGTKGLTNNPSRWRIPPDEMQSLVEQFSARGSLGFSAGIRSQGDLAQAEELLQLILNSVQTRLLGLIPLGIAPVFETNPQSAGSNVQSTPALKSDAAKENAEVAQGTLRPAPIIIDRNDPSRIY